MKKNFSLNKYHSKILITLIFIFSFFCLNIPPVSASDGQWIITGSMNNYHQAHTVTLLPNGKVLVAGGCSDISCSSVTASAELYDPATGTWTVTGSMNTAREQHTATLLPDGKVLVAGGELKPSTILASAELYDPETGIWTYTDSMDNSRYAYSATKLPDGKVLVAGGVGEGYLFLFSAEIYDMSTGLWTVTGSMNESRSTTASILLHNGKVLIAGGQNNVFLTSAELYDPITGIWTYTGSMNTNHHYHPLVQLANGKVLLAGAPENSSCELYNPDTGTWAYTGSMNAVRRGAAIALLPNGNVLAAGGSIYGIPGMTTSAEVYNPITGTWTNINPMNIAKPGIAVLLQNGNVLVAGGTSAELYYENYAPTADAGPDQSVNTMSLVTLDGSDSNDPNRDPLIYSWTQTGGTSVSLSDPTAVNPTFTAPGDPDILTFSLVVTDNLGMSSEPDEVVIVVNNQAPVANAGPNQSVSTLSLITLDGTSSYDPDGDIPLTYQWTQVGGTSVVLNYPTSVHPTFTAPSDPATLIFSLVVRDSLGLASAPDEVVITTHSNGQWIITGSLNNARQWHTATLLPNGKVLVTGGNNFSSTLASAELYNPSTGSWTITGSLNSGRYLHAAVLLTNGKVLVVGGQNDSSALASAELFNPGTGTWETTGSMHTARNFFTATLLPNGKVLVVGGCSNDCRYSSLSSAELYDPISGTWTNTGSMNSNRASHTATLLPNGKVLVAGGETVFPSYFKTINSAQLYNPDTGTWQSLASMISERASHTATLLPNGKVLVAGGIMAIYYYGQCNWNIHTISSAEIYDPATDTWESTNPRNHVGGGSATLLPNGKVLVAGGGDYVDICGIDFHSFTLSTAEIYDPVSGLWQEISSLNNSRSGFPATLLQDGNLLVEGGAYENYPTHYSLSAAEFYYENYAPTADAGPDQSVNTMSLVTLDGSDSNDPNGDPLIYSWTQTGGTSVSLSDPTAVNPTFTAPGDPDILTFSLVVTDSLGLASEPDEVVITTRYNIFFLPLLNK